MTWVKLPDEALDDPRVLDLADDVVLGYLRALAWSNRWARNGLVPASKAPAAEAWIAAGLATVDDEGIRLQWLMEYQPTAEEIERKRRYDAERQARRRRHNNGDHEACDPTRCRVLLSQRDSVVSRSVNPPSRPDSDSFPTLRRGGGVESGSDDSGSNAPVVAPRTDEERIANALKILNNPGAYPPSKKAAERELRTLGVEVPAA